MEHPPARAQKTKGEIKLEEIFSDSLGKVMIGRTPYTTYMKAQKIGPFAVPPLDEMQKWVPVSEAALTQIVRMTPGGRTASRGMVKDAIDILLHDPATLRNLTPALRYISTPTSPSSPQSLPQAWDRETASFTTDFPYEDTLYEFPIAPSPTTPSSDPENPSKAYQFILDLAKGRPEVADDILQTLAPFVMTDRPAGIVWYIGKGANGKSSLHRLVSSVLPPLASMDIDRISDGRDLPSLNRSFGNFVSESGQGFVENTTFYKLLATHEQIEVHKFHSQEGATVNADLHHVFNSNSMPEFAEKNDAIIRRTVTVPFDARFRDDPTFEKRTFTPEFRADFLRLLLDAATRMQSRPKIAYELSPYSQSMQANLVKTMNSAELFFDYITAPPLNLIAFSDYSKLRLDYEEWCAQNGLTPLGITRFRHAATAFGFKDFDTGGRITVRYIPTPDNPLPPPLEELQMFSVGVAMRKTGYRNPLASRQEITDAHRQSPSTADQTPTNQPPTDQSTEPEQRSLVDGW